MTRRSYIAAPSPRASSGRASNLALAPPVAKWGKRQLARAIRVPERDVLRACLDLLAVKHIWHRRMNTGAVKAEGRFFRFGSVGMADVLASPKVKFAHLSWEGAQDIAKKAVTRLSLFLWVEVKASDGKQSEAQRAFQAEVEAEGHSYLLVSDVDQLAEWLKERGL